MKTINLLLQRTFKHEKYTIGKLYINGDFFCDTLEDKVRDLNKDGDLNDPGEAKIYGETAIPYGKYYVMITMSQRFKKRLPLITNVPHFEGIRIHGGNTAKDTHGCILVGENKYTGMVSNSQAKMAELMLILTANDVKDIWIEII